MSPSIVVITKISSMFLVMLLGYGARRSGRVDAATTTLLGALTASVCLPALTFAQLLATIDARRLAAGWMLPLMGAGVIVMGHVVGKVLCGAFAAPRQAPTFVFACATANWIYLPLPIVEALHGAAGVEALLLVNAGAQLVLWSLGVATLRGARVDAQALSAIAKNPGLLATVLGISVALLVPRGAMMGGVVGHVWRAIVEGIALVGSLTIPLSLIVTGAQLGAEKLAKRPSRAALGVTLVRLAIAPTCALALVWIARRAGVVLPSPATAIVVLVAGMPVAVSAGILAAKYEQDTALASESIFVSTLGSVATAPLVVAAYALVS